MKASSTTTRQYLLAQFFFWGVYAGFNILIFSVFVALKPISLLITLLLSVWMAFGSHFLRLLYKRYALNWSAGRLVLAALISIPVLAVVLQWLLSFSVALLVNLSPILKEGYQATTTAQTFVYSLNMMIILGLWTAVYLSIDQFRRRRETEIAHWRIQAQLHEAELQFLRSQINSHFLFNALNNLRALIRENPELARERLTQLAALLRAILQVEQRDKVPLDTELDIVRGYLDLESLQFEDRLHVEWQIDDNTRQLPVPAMLIQTLVENAIKHGIACRRHGGTVAIAARVQGNALQISIRNPPPESDARSSGTGLGLNNARERLQRLFGTRASLLLQREDSQITALVEIPL